MDRVLDEAAEVCRVNTVSQTGRTREDGPRELGPALVGLGADNSAKPVFDQSPERRSTLVHDPANFVHQAVCNLDGGPHA